MQIVGLPVGPVLTRLTLVPLPGAGEARLWLPPLLRAARAAGFFWPSGDSIVAAFSVSTVAAFSAVQQARLAKDKQS